jgi:hypothetical protein
MFIVISETAESPERAALSARPGTASVSDDDMRRVNRTAKGLRSGVAQWLP